MMLTIRAGARSGVIPARSAVRDPGEHLVHLSPAQTDASAGRSAHCPSRRLLLGLVLALSAWGFSWFGPERISAHTFFPLWLGYILVVDGIVEIRSGSSLWTRNPVALVTLFVLSMPFWWIFEAANVRLQNWHYHVPDVYGWPHLRVEQGIAFSTVLPAIFETSDLVKSTAIGQIGARSRTFALSRARLVKISLLGVLMVIGVLLLPRFLFPLVWIGGFLAIDPINALGGRPSLLASASRGRWTPAIVLAVASLICGFFWEMWNIRASAKWTYDIPYFDWLHIFEMPLLGYGGYIPFALELYAAYHLVSALLPSGMVASLSIDQCEHAARESIRS